MSTQNQAENMEFSGITFRRFQGEADLPLLLAIVLNSAAADQIVETATLEDIRAWFAPTPRFDPDRDLFLAVEEGAGGADVPVGFSRASWYSGPGGIRLYSNTTYLGGEWRERGIWPLLIRRSEQRLREIAAGHPPAPGRFLQAWATEKEAQKIDQLQKEGYQAVRHFHNMLRRLQDLPQPGPLPPGFEIRPVQPEHFRPIWEAEKEVNAGLFEYFAEHWDEEKYPAWLGDPSHTPHLWQVAWDGEQVAGMVLNRIDAAENASLNRQRGYTEHVFVRAPWRGRGLARALLLGSLHLLKEQGMAEAELGVDSENESGAFEFYSKLGYQTFSTDIWFRKPLD